MSFNLDVLRQRIEKEREEAIERISTLNEKVEHYNFMLGEMKQQESNFEDEQRNERFFKAQAREEEKKKKQPQTQPDPATSSNIQRIIEYNEKNKGSSAV